MEKGMLPLEKSVKEEIAKKKTVLTSGKKLKTGLEKAGKGRVMASLTGKVPALQLVCPMLVEKLRATWRVKADYISLG